MNKNNLIKKLENLDLSGVELPSHQRRLKKVLLDSGYFKKRTNMLLFKKFAPIGAVAIVALLIVGLNYFKNSSSITNDLLAPRQALAMDFIEKSKETISTIKTLPPLVITKRVDGGTEVSSTVSSDDYLNFLEEAKQAQDLAYIGDKVLPDGERIKVLHYTLDYSKLCSRMDCAYDPHTIILGIDEKNLPVVRIDYDPKAGGGTAFQRNGLKDPDAPRPQNIKEEIDQWTENLENPPQESQEKIDFDFEAIQK